MPGVKTVICRAGPSTGAWSIAFNGMPAALSFGMHLEKIGQAISIMKRARQEGRVNRSILKKEVSHGRDKACRKPGKISRRISRKKKQHQRTDGSQTGSVRHFPGRFQRQTKNL